MQGNACVRVFMCVCVARYLCMCVCVWVVFYNLFMHAFTGPNIHLVAKMKVKVKELSLFQAKKSES